MKFQIHRANPNLNYKPIKINGENKRKLNFKHKSKLKPTHSTNRKPDLVVTFTDPSMEAADLPKRRRFTASATGKTRRPAYEPAKYQQHNGTPKIHSQNVDRLTIYTKPATKTRRIRYSARSETGSCRPRRLQK